MWPQTGLFRFIDIVVGADFAAGDIVGAPSGVRLRRGHLLLEPCFEVVGGGLRRIDALDQLLHENTAPTAARTGSLAFAQTTGHANFVHAYVIDHLAPCDMKAQAKFVVRLHERSTALRCGRR